MVWALMYALGGWPGEQQTHIRQSVTRTSVKMEWLMYYLYQTFQVLLTPFIPVYSVIQLHSSKLCTMYVRTSVCVLQNKPDLSCSLLSLHFHALGSEHIGTEGDQHPQTSSRLLRDCRTSPEHSKAVMRLHTHVVPYPCSNIGTRRCTHTYTL